jgi:hypothetical protein
VDLWKVHHLAAELNLGETFVDKQIVFLMHGSMASLAGSGKDLETSTKSKKS